MLDIVQVKGGMFPVLVAFGIAQGIEPVVENTPRLPPATEFLFVVARQHAHTDITLGVCGTENKVPAAYLL